MELTSTWRDLPELLHRLDDDLRAHGEPRAAELAPGLSEQSVREALADIGFVPPAELVHWFGWHNGLGRSRGWNVLLGTWLPMSLAEAIDDRKDWPIGDGPAEWLSHWLAIAKDGSGSRLAVRCNKDEREEALVHACVPQYGLFDFEEVPAVLGLHQVVSWWLTGLEQGWMTYKPDTDEWDDRNWLQFPQAWRSTSVV